MRDRAVEELHVLRQVSNDAAEVLAGTLVGRGPIEPYRPGAGRNQSHQHAGQRGLARARGTDHAQPLPRFDLEDQSLQQRLVRSGHGDAEIIHFQKSLRRRKRHALSLGWHLRQHTAQALHGLVKSLQLLPVANRLFDGCQPPRHDDRGSDDGARRNLAFDGKIGAKRQDARLHEQPHHPRHGAVAATPVAGVALLVEGQLLQCLPALPQHATHAKCVHGFGVAAHFICKDRCARRHGPGFRQRSARGAFCQQRQAKDHDGRDEASNTKPHMQLEDDEQVDRHPRHVEEGKRALAADELPHGLEVHQRLPADAGDTLKGELCHGVKNPRPQHLFEAPGNPVHDPSAQVLEKAVIEVEDEHQRR